jgi:hypothetical protein
MATITPATLERLRRAHAKVARLVVADPTDVPVFTRLEAEISEAEAVLSGDVIARARAVARQRATDCTTA